MAKKNTSNPFLSQATTSAQLRYLPQIQQLALLRSSRRSDYLNSSRQADLAARIIANGNSDANKGLADFMSRIGTIRQGITGPNMGEAGIVANNLGLTAQSAGAMLANNTSRAYQGSVYQRQKLRDNYLGDKAQIDQQAQNLSAQYGLDVQSTYDQLVAANEAATAKAQEGRLNRQTQRLVGGVDIHGNPTPAAKAKINAKNRADTAKQRKANAGRLPGGAKPVPASSVESATTAIGYATSQAQRLKAIGYSQSEIRDLLTGGRQSQTVKVGKDRQTIPGIRATSPLWVQVALETMTTGTVSKKTIKRLHSLGYDLKRLGISTKPNYSQVAQTVTGALNFQAP